VKNGSLAGDRLYPDSSPVVPDDPLTDGQPQTYPPLLGCEEWGEDLLQHFTADSLSRVPDEDSHRIAGVAFDPERPA